jgi:predicted DNA-binding transcriptional regulator YafY
MTCVNGSRAAALCSLHILREIYEGGILYYAYKNAPCQWAREADCITAKKFSDKNLKNAKKRRTAIQTAKKEKREFEFRRGYMSSKPSSFERSWRILEYLRRNTDAEHPVRGLSTLLKDCEALELSSYISQKDTFKSTVRNMAIALNSDADGHILPQDQWKLVYKDFLERYGATDENGSMEDEEDLEAPEGTPAKRTVSPPVKDLFYRRTFSYDEINSLIEGVLSSRTLDTREARRLVRKIEQNLTTKFHPKGPKSIYKVRESIPADWELVRENLLRLQEAIDSRRKVSFRFRGYNCRRELVPVRPERDIVSPYYCVAYGGRYYLLACKDGKTAMSIWRIDLMWELECLGPGHRAMEKEEVEDLPLEWDERFPLNHLGMSFDRPIPIKLRIVNPWRDKDGGTWTNYTFLVDWFGDSFDYERTETEPPYGDIVRVTCSPYGMVNWALQYSGRVEVLEPQSVREAVAEKIRALNEKYRIAT